MTVGVKVVKAPEMTVWERLYLPMVFKGLAITFSHFFRKSVTVQFPEERPEYPYGSRGLHRLNRDSDGRVKCVACDMCATACPANCISIVGQPSPWPDREKMPETFEINLLRCIFCGFCEEACPEDAIELTGIHDFASDSRENMIIDREGLLAVYDKTAPSRPRRAGKTASEGASNVEREGSLHA
ncbi:MAG: NADH-quinone oxidoreductase subunit I [Planctomycetes bacterium]|nr:NADH-quinone oxidoreductase subunit I [Planctomycetota bacterium]MBI3846030.1 NADH-quinone oxidoreductase subunit I [Planctomycetota bacterium]